LESFVGAQIVDTLHEFVFNNCGHLISLAPFLLLRVRPAVRYHLYAIFLLRGSDFWRNGCFWRNGFVEMDLAEWICRNGSAEMDLLKWIWRNGFVEMDLVKWTC
jgi:hypothetical protein